MCRNGYRRSTSATEGTFSTMVTLAWDNVVQFCPNVTIRRWPVAAPRPATIRTVADRAGVSKSLVSLVLRGSPNVSDAKRLAVQQAIDELGYRPHAIARQLTERRTNMVGVLLNDLRNPWFIDCLEGLTSVLHEQGLRTLLADGRMDRPNNDSLLEGFLELRVDRLVLVGTMSSLPTGVAASRDISLPKVDVIANDDWIGTQLAVNHLADLGHTRIAHLAGSLGA